VSGLLITSANWGALEDAVGRRIRTFAPGVGSAQARIAQRVEFTPHSMPSATGALAITHEFANEQAMTKVDGFGLSIPTPGTASAPALTELGVVLSFSGNLTAAPNYLIGLGHYWEEGVILVTGPMVAGVDHRLGNDSGQFHRGRLVIAIESGVPRFVWTQANAAGDAVQRFVFDSITVPITLTGGGSVRKPIYYRFVRNLEPGVGGKIQLRVWLSGAAAVQEITSIPIPNPVSSSTQRLGGNQGTASPASITFLWWRAQGSDTYPGAQDFGFADYWTTPVVFTAASYVSHGASPAGFLDSGAAARYWHGLSVSTVVSRGGGVVRLRFAANDTLPGGTGSGFISGGFETLASFPAIVDLEDEQGRYLILELSFVPGTEADMGLNEAMLEGVFGQAAEMGTAEHGIAPNGSADPALIEVSLGGEGAATASLPYPPHFPTEVDEQFRSHQTPTESGHLLSRPLGTAVRRTWRARWALDLAEGDALLGFLEGQGADAFVFAPPLATGGALVTAAVRGPIRARRAPPAGYEIEAELVEVFP